MNLDKTLSQEMKNAIDMGIFSDFADAGKENTDKYPELSKQQFADPANKAFPVDTSEHCRAAMVYLNKYYNNKPSEGVTANYTPEKFKGVHNRIVKAMKKFGIEHAGCSICKKVTKGGLEDMKKEETEITEAEITEEKVEEEVSVSEEEETIAEVTEEKVLETDVEPDPIVAEDTEKIVSEESVEEVTDENIKELNADAGYSVLNQLRDISRMLIETVRSLEDATAVSEAKTEVETLSSSLAEATEKIHKYEAMELGAGRLSILMKQGIVFADDGKAEKAMRLGVMSEEDFIAYQADLLSVVKASASEEEEITTEEEETNASTRNIVPTFFLPNVESSEQVGEKESFKRIYA